MIDARIGVAVRAPASDALHAALSRLAERCTVVALTDGGPFDAVVRSTGTEPAYGERTVRWVEDEQAVLPTDAAALLAAPEVARALRGSAGTPVVALGPAARHRSARPLMPFTRARLRRARGLAGPAVARCSDGAWTWDGRALDEAAAPTAAALASVVVTDDAEAAVLAAAWSAAVVVPSEIADRTGLPAAPTPDLDAAVAALLDDEVACSALARACRRAYELDHDPETAVAHLGEILGIRPTRPWDSGYSSPLDRLGTPADARVRDRAHTAAHALRSR